MLLPIEVHTIAVLQGQEYYDHLKEGFEPVLSEMNELLMEKQIEVYGHTFQLQFYVGGDYKVMMR